MGIYEELEWRGLIKDVSSPDIREKLNKGGMTFYIGTDPTGDSLHIGHFSSFLISKRLKDAGHNPILLVGGGTGLIGDPKPDAERPMITREAVDHNFACLKAQAEKVFGFEVVNNYDWLKDFTIIDWLRDVGKYFNIGYMLNKDIVKRRLDEGITYTEFSYMTMQAYDFLHLHNAKGVDLQVAGQDQWGNITAGIELVRKKQNEEVYGFTMPLLTKSDGTKFGKTNGKAIWLDINKTEYPQMPGMLLTLYCETNYLGVGGKSPLFTKTDRKITQMVERAYRNKTMVAREYRHRAVVWGVQSQYFFEMLNWLANCWGILPLTDMLSMLSTRVIAEEDTPENRELAFYDMAWLTENMIMRNRTHGGYRVLLDELWEYCEEFNADVVILWEHMSCKALEGLHGQFEEQARAHGLHLIWVAHDLCDPRIMSRQGIRDQINRYMRTVFREEPLDPTLEVLHDELSW